MNKAAWLKVEMRATTLYFNLAPWLDPPIFWNQLSKPIECFVPKIKSGFA